MPFLAACARNRVDSRLDGELHAVGGEPRLAVLDGPVPHVDVDALGDQQGAVSGLGQEARLAGRGVSDFFKIELTIPSLPEQQKIATFLSAIDEKINQCSAQIEKMEAWKKGLLQQMFC